MNITHTPGPWAYYPDAVAVCVVRNHTVKVLADFGKCDLPETEANARLIAAAPELLEAISTMLGAAEADCLDDKSNVWRSAMIGARAAIAKATGETP